MCRTSGTSEIRKFGGIGDFRVIDSPHDYGFPARDVRNAGQ